MLAAQTNTMMFRVAVSVCALWVIGIGLVGVSEYRSIRAYYDRDGYQEGLDRCSDQQPDFSAVGSYKLRNPTTADLQNCVSDQMNFHKRLEDDEKGRVKTGAALAALVPAIILLVLAAFAPSIWSGVSRISRAYVRWLKGNRELEGS